MTAVAGGAAGAVTILGYHPLGGLAGGRRRISFMARCLGRWMATTTTSAMTDTVL